MRLFNTSMLMAKAADEGHNNPWLFLGCADADYADAKNISGSFVLFLLMHVNLRPQNWPRIAPAMACSVETPIDLLRRLLSRPVITSRRSLLRPVRS